MKNSAPKHLNPAARRWRATLAREYGIADAGGAALLTSAAESWQDVAEYRAIRQREGSIVLDRFQQPKPHPAAALERDARAQLLKALAALNLDVEPLKRPGRPPSEFSWGG